jgi:hypothetical protein
MLARCVATPAAVKQMPDPCLDLQANTGAGLSLLRGASDVLIVTQKCATNASLHNDAAPDRATQRAVACQACDLNASSSGVPASALK